MKHGLKPTKRQREAIQAARLNSNNWLVVRVLTNSQTIEIVHRETGSVRKIPA